MKIVVPLDLSNTSREAIEPAVEIARGMGDEVQLVTVAGKRLRADLREVVEAEHTTVPEMIESFLKSTAASISDVEADFSLIHGDDAADALVNYARGEGVRMIVIATHGRAGFEKWRLGSVTERVIQHAEVPVLVVPTRQHSSS